MTETHHPNPRRTKFKAGTELRERILEAASRLLAEDGYQNVSMRKIAEDAGCSQMAAYRHFADKDALIRQLRLDSYNQFVTVNQRLEHLTDPVERLRQTLHEFLKLVVTHPREYRLAFLTPASDGQELEWRVQVTKPFTAYFLEWLQRVLPPETEKSVAEEKLLQIVACLHGMSVMLINYPRAYGLTIERAIRELDSAFDRIVLSR
jgi:AcrR family transcriptional regulator